MRLWVVFCGEYSDRGIVGVFSSKEKAEEYIANYDGDTYYTPYIETALDVDVPLTTEAGWHIVIRTQWNDGEARREKIMSHVVTVGERNESQIGESEDVFYKCYDPVVGVHAEQFSSYAWDCDEERAKKIAYDRLAECRYRWEMEHHS